MKFEFSEFSSKAKFPVILRRWQFLSPEILTTLRWQALMLTLSICKTMILYFIYYQRAFSQKSGIKSKRKKLKFCCCLLFVICSGEVLSPFSQINSQYRTDQWWIEDFPEGAPTYYLAKYSKKLHELPPPPHLFSPWIRPPLLMDIEWDRQHVNKLTWTYRKFCLCECARI